MNKNKQSGKMEYFHNSEIIINKKERRNFCYISSHTDVLKIGNRLNETARQRTETWRSETYQSEQPGHEENVSWSRGWRNER